MPGLRLVREVVPFRQGRSNIKTGTFMTVAACATAAWARRGGVAGSLASGVSDMGAMMISAEMAGSIKGDVLMRRCFTRPPPE